MLRTYFRNNVANVLRAIIIVLACNTLALSYAYDQPSSATKDTKTADASDSATSKEVSETKLTKSEQVEKEFHTALEAELKRRGLTESSVVCDTIARPGSRIRTRECMTIASWIEMRLAERDQKYKLQVNRAPRAWDTGP